MVDERFSFRWGIPWLDAGFVTVPNFFFRRYVEVGVSREEFLFILHLASYKFESARGRSSPSMPTIAAQMGYSKRQVQRLREALVKKALLIVTERPGRPSVYSFENLSIRLLQVELRGDTHVTHDTHVTPTHDTHVTPPMTPMSPEEQQARTRREEQQQPAVAFSLLGGEEGKALLVSCGVAPDVAEKLVQEQGLKRIREVIEGLGERGGIRNGAGWVVAALREGYDIGDSAKAQRNGELLHRQMKRCAWQRNTSLGDCESILRREAAMPWCMVCERLAAARAAAGED